MYGLDQIKAMNADAQAAHDAENAAPGHLTEIVESFELPSDSEADAEIAELLAVRLAGLRTELHTAEIVGDANLREARHARAALANLFGPCRAVRDALRWDEEAEAWIITLTTHKKDRFTAAMQAAFKTIDC